MNPPDDLERTLGRLLSRPIQDEDKVLETIVNAITCKYTDPGLVNQAVKQAVSNYENQLRVFMVAVANRQLGRIMRLMRSLDSIEEQLETNPNIMMQMEAKDLVRLYALQQSNLMSSLDYVRKIADMRIELASAQAAITSTMTSRDVEEIHALSGLPKLTSQQRHNVRRLIEGLVQDVHEESKDLEVVLQEGFDKPNGGNGTRAKL